MAVTLDSPSGWSSPCRFSNARSLFALRVGALSLGVIALIAAIVFYAKGDFLLGHCCIGGSGGILLTTGLFEGVKRVYHACVLYFNKPALPSKKGEVGPVQARESSVFKYDESPIPVPSDIWGQTSGFLDITSLVMLTGTSKYFYHIFNKNQACLARINSHYKASQIRPVLPYAQSFVRECISSQLPSLFFIDEPIEYQKFDSICEHFLPMTEELKTSFLLAQDTHHRWFFMARVHISWVDPMNDQYCEDHGLLLFYPLNNELDGGGYEWRVTCVNQGHHHRVEVLERAVRLCAWAVHSNFFLNSLCSLTGEASERCSDNQSRWLMHSFSIWQPYGRSAPSRSVPI